MENLYDDEFRAMNFCKGMLELVPEMKEMFEKMSEAMDELMELNKDIMEDLGRRLVRACLKNTSVFSEQSDKIFRDPNLVFQQAVDNAVQHISDFVTAQHKESRDKVLQLIDRYWDEAKNDLNEPEEEEEA